MSGEYKYKAFISYSHKDKSWAKWLHRRLENYSFPKYLDSSSSQDNSISVSLKPIFRDREELAAGYNLGEKIETALQASENLIIICSPHAARSHWVNQEILFFKRNNRKAKIFSVIVGGIPFATDAGNDDQECFPEALRFGVDDRGNLSRVKIEPLAADLRDHGDGKRLGLLKLISGMVGLGLNDLVQRDVQRARKRVIAVTALAAATVLIMGTLTWMAVDARIEAERRLVIAEGQIEFMVSDLRKEVEKVGRLDALRIVGDRALEYYEENPPAQNDLGAIRRRARVKSMLGEILLQAKDYEGAKKYFDDGLSDLRSAYDRYPNEQDLIFDLSQTEFWRGNVEFEGKRYSLARSYFEEYLQYADRLTSLNPDNHAWQMESIYARQNLAVIEYKLGNVDIALNEVDGIIIELERIAADIKTDPETSQNIAYIYAWAADFNQHREIIYTLSFRQKQYSVLSQLYQKNSKDDSVLFEKLQAVVGLARVHIDMGDSESAKILLNKYIIQSDRLRRQDSKNKYYAENYDLIEKLLNSTENQSNEN